MSDWVTVQPSLDPILAPVNAILGMIDGLLSALLVILNIIQTILNIIKAFLLGLLDPLKAIIKAIIAEIRAIINDLRQMGLYVHIGDIRLIDVKNNYQDIRGGFNAYERRMIARLTDRRDPTRPDFSSSSAALGFFIYLSGQDVDALVRALTAFYNFFFNRPVPVQAAFPQPTGLEVVYGDGLTSFKDLGSALTGESPLPEKAMVKWSLPPGPGPGSGFKVPVPKGWILEVSTVEGGMRVVGSAPLDRNAPGLYPSQVTAVAVDPVTSGLLNVYGASEVVGSNRPDYSDVWPSNPQDPRAVKWFFQKDINTPLLPPKALSSANGGPWLGAAYFVPSAASLLYSTPGQEFTAVFDKSMLPKDADVVQDSGNQYGITLTERTPPSYFVTVRAVSKSVVEAIGASGASERNPHRLTDEELRLFKYGVDNVRNAVSGRLVPSEPSADVGFADFGVASSPVSMTFPGESSVAYQQAIQLALIVMLLSRSDANQTGSLDNEFEAGLVVGQTGLEEVSRKLIPLMKFGGKGNFYAKPYLKWRDRVYQKTLAYADQLYKSASLSETLMAVVVEMAEPLFTKKWNQMGIRYRGNSGPDMTIGETFGITDGYVSENRNDPYKGAAPNPGAVPFVSRRYESPIDYYAENGGPVRAPGFLTQLTAENTLDQWIEGNGSLDAAAPVIYSRSSNGADITFVAFARNLLLSDPDVLGAAASVLKVTATVRSPRDGGWYVTRPLYEMLAPLDQILTNVEAWLLALLGALDGIIERIVDFIEAVQARIYQLQALIEWIRSLLRTLDFALPSVSGLVVVANGTDGILKDFVSAGNKPSDDAQALGAGLAIVTGGLPNALLDLFAAVFASGPAEEGA